MIPVAKLIYQSYLQRVDLYEIRDTNSYDKHYKNIFNDTPGKTRQTSLLLTTSDSHIPPSRYNEVI